MKIQLLSTLLATSLVSGVAAQSSAPLVDLGYVKLQGVTNDSLGINYYNGVRFAQPPLGDLRWRAPQPIEWKNDYNGGVADATQIPAVCVQGTPYFQKPGATPIPNQSEDCLFLDVSTPIKPASSSLPVLVSIHGGGYAAGSAAVTNGNAIINRTEGGIVYVAIQYRLGAYGFLGGAEVVNDGVLNAGLLDQRAALDWVQRHISAFGGDPARVTIVGGSAGGGSVSYQVTGFGGTGTPPFHAAIAQYPWWQPMATPSTQELQYRSILEFANCPNIECLRALDPATLQAATLNSYVTRAQPQYGFGSFDYGPVIDGEFVRELPDQAYKLGNFYDVPLIVDHDGYEGFLFSDMTIPSQEVEQADAQLLFPSGGPSFFSKLYELYPASEFNSSGFQRQTWFGDFIIDCPTYIMASQAVDHNSNPSAVYKTVFKAGTELHGAIGPFMWSATGDFLTANNFTLAEIMSGYYYSFVLTGGDPNAMKSPLAGEWLPYNANGLGSVASGESVGFNVLEVTYTTVENIPDPDAAAQCFFFSANGHVLAN